MKPVMLGASVFALTMVGFAARAETACNSLVDVKLPHATVTKATQEMLGDKMICKISVTAKPTADSDIRMELWIPEGANWNGKFVQLGNGGFAGTIPVAQFPRLARAGYAVAATDDGHQDPVGTNASWALGHPEKVVDFGWRALKETTEASKALIAANRGKISRSYFVGCSDGGREALMEAQRYPTDFDGIVAGAPANYMSQLFALSSYQQQIMARPGGYLGKDQRDLLQKSVLAECGGEAFIRDPLACKFDPGKLTCKAGQTEGCLTAAQVASARAFYDGRKDKSGKIVFPGYSPGAEGLNGSWNAWITGPTAEANQRAAGPSFSSNAFKYFGFQDPNFDYLKIDTNGAQFDGAIKKMAAALDSPDPNLAAFKSHGGKLIQYHGWNDPAIPPRSSIVYYEDVRKKMGDPSDFYRMYLVPGMLHCAGGVGPSNVDWVAALDAWVNAGKAPGDVTAAGGAGQAPGGPASQLLCPYPGVARKTGEAWACAVPAKKKG